MRHASVLFVSLRILYGSKSNHQDMDRSCLYPFGTKLSTHARGECEYGQTSQPKAKKPPPCFSPVASHVFSFPVPLTCSFSNPGAGLVDWLGARELQVPKRKGSKGPRPARLPSVFARGEAIRLPNCTASESTKPNHILHQITEPESRTNHNDTSQANQKPNQQTRNQTKKSKPNKSAAPLDIIGHLLCPGGPLQRHHGFLDPARPKANHGERQDHRMRTCPSICLSSLEEIAISPVVMIFL